MMKTELDNAPALSFTDVSFRYASSEDWALRDITFSLAAGEVLAVLGDNGAGKSSLCKCANGIVPQTEGGYFQGTVRALGLDTREHPVSVLAGRAGLVLDDPDSQLFSSSVLDEVAFGPENLGFDRERIRASADHLVRTVGLAGMEQRSPGTLSGGQKQRLTIAAVLAMESKVLVLDEPTSQLDSEGAEELLGYIAEVRERYGLAVVVATHDLDLVSRFADTALLLEKGRMAAYGPAQEVLDLVRRNEAADRGMRATDTGTTPRAPAAAGSQPTPVLSSPPLRAVDIDFAYPQGGFALRGVSLSMNKGEFLGIIGRNGSGKTTLLKCLIGLIKPSRGAIYLGGQDMGALAPAALAAKIGYVQQNPDLQLFADTAEKEVAFGPMNSGLPRTEVDTRVRNALERVGLWQKRKEHPFSFSRSERALIAFASVLAMESGILLLDEPTAGQDRKGSVQVMELARSLCAQGRTVAAVCHDVRMLSAYADRLLEMDAGSIVEDGDGAEECKEEPLCV